MARWARAWVSSDLAGDCRRVQAPTIIVTGESHLDRVVPVEQSVEYLSLIPGSRHEVIRDTGHLSFLLRPTDLARTVVDFARCSTGATPREKLQS
jgi:pimeloyl-ACP methyl ester carboxylesterase